MKKKVITTVVAIVAAILVILVTRYTGSEEYQLKKDLRTAEKFFERKDYESAVDCYLSVLEKKDEVHAKQGIVKAYIALAGTYHEKKEDDKAKETLILALMFEPANEEIKRMSDEWFPIHDYEVPVRNLLTGMIEGRSKTLFSAFYPKLLDDYVMAYQEAGLSEDVFYQNMDSEMETYDGGYIIQSATPLSGVEQIAYEVALYEDYGIRVSVTNGYMITVCACYADETEVDDIPVYQIDGQWYVSHEYMGL